MLADFLGNPYPRNHVHAYFELIIGLTLCQTSQLLTKLRPHEPA